MGRIGGHVAAPAVLGPAAQASCEHTVRRIYGRLDLPRSITHELALCECRNRWRERQRENQAEAQCGVSKFAELKVLRGMNDVKPRLDSSARYGRLALTLRDGEVF
jgi:hypothetical protein